MREMETVELVKQHGRQEGQRSLQITFTLKISYMIV